jgi:hypothetical protein
MFRLCFRPFTLPVLVSCLGMTSLGIHAAPLASSGSYSAPIREDLPQLLWGDTHLHTSLSADAYTMETRLSKEMAYRFARGETVIADNGMPVKLRRPLDFLAITDHAEYLGTFVRINADDSLEQDWALGRKWDAYMKSGDAKALSQSWVDAMSSTNPADALPANAVSDIWREAAVVADAYNNPGVFTAFVGYEWTSMVSGDNLHRVVIYRDGADKAAQHPPFSAQDSTDPEDLWTALENYEKDVGGQVLAIAHNGNVSNGRMFSPVRENGQIFDEAYASRRMRWEPVYEVTQVKGDGETHPYLSPDDEFADFETWDEGNILMSHRKEKSMLKTEYARSALQEGLRHEAKLGTNPFKFGMIGSTDMHTGLATADEDNYFGKFAHDEPAAGRTQLHMAHKLQETWKLGAAGLAAVSAKDNSRAAIFDAIRRKEVYGTTGPRIQVRFFGGWDFKTTDVQRSDYAVVGYRKGVPMGGDLTQAPAQTQPSFMILASKDPDGANLDRVQVVKGWLDKNGNTREKIFNVALSDQRQNDPETGKAPAVGNTVNLADTSYSNSIGAPQLATVWTDPEFDPAQRAFYYLRVLEIPTPRWTAYDAEFFGEKFGDEVPMVVQDRAYTSPIWYTP